MFPASTIQLLGAEKALFRHLKNKKYQSPKFGVLHDHPLVLKAKRNERGRIARILADKICIAAKVDYFKGKYVGDKLLADLERRLK
jgi:nucleolar protein 56